MILGIKSSITFQIRGSAVANETSDIARRIGNDKVSNNNDRVPNR